MGIGRRGSSASFEKQCRQNKYRLTGLVLREIKRVMRFFPSVILFAIVLVSQTPAGAATVTYTFESPVFSLGQTTPLLNKSPNIGSPSFLASFNSSPAGNGFSIGNNPNLFNGLSLMDPGSPAAPDVLTITLNSPINGVQLDFALFQSGRLDLNSAVGGVSALTGPGLQVGVLTFTSGIPFTQFTLAGFSAPNTPVLLAIDNLVLTVPEPSTLALIGTGIFAALFRKRFRHLRLRVS